VKYILISLLILFFGYFGVLNPVRDAYQWLFSPVQFGMNKGAKSIKDTFEFYSNVKKVRSQNLHLETKILKLESQLVDLEKLQQENQALRSQIQNLEELGIEEKVLLAYTMGNNQDTTGSSVYINKGYLHKVKSGDVVIIDNIVIGLVKDVSANKSLVELITSSEISATVYDLSSPQKTEGLAMGRFGTSIVIERILPGEDIEPGDIIVTSGKDGIFLPGLYVGKVEEVVDDPSQPLKKAFVSTMVDYSKLDKVFVVIGTNDE
jgi:rod shape-determining protein MreC